MDNYKDYPCLKNYYSAVSSTVNCTSSWSNAYGSDPECSTSAKWSNSMDANYCPGVQSAYYPTGSAIVKSEYESIFDQSSECLGEADQTFKYNFYGVAGDGRAVASQSTLCTSTATSSAHASGSIACPPDSTFSPNSLTVASTGHGISKNSKSTESSTRPSKGKADSRQKSQCSSSSATYGGNKGADGAPRKATLRPHSTPATLMWLESNYELADGVCIPRSVLYMHYVDFCSLNHVQPVNAASFGKIIRQQFSHLTTRRLGTRGQSRYHYYGIGIKENSSYYQLSYSKKSVQMHSAESSSKAHKNGASAYARHHQGKVHTGKLASKLTVNGKMGRLDCNSMNYFEGADTGQAERPTPEMVSCHSSKMYTHLGSSTKPCKGSLPEKQLDQGTGTLIGEFGSQLSPGASSSGKSNPSGSLVSSFVPALPPFPTAEELELCRGSHNNLVSTFLLMYRAHCQRILDAIVRANFEELNTLVYHFWQKIPHHLTAVLSSPLLINLLGICDIRLYRTIVKLISVTLAQPLAEIAYSQLENFVSNLDSVLSAALRKENPFLQQIKLELARHFAGIIKCLLRHSRLYHSVQGPSSSANCQAALKQLYLDWSRLDLSSLSEQLAQQYGRICKLSDGNCLKRVQQLLYKHCTEFKLFLAGFTDYSQLFEWFEGVWQVSLQWYPHSTVSPKGATSIGLQFANSFLVLWTCARLRIGQELSRTKAPSEDLFATLSALFDDFCVYKVKDLYFDDCTTLLFSNATTNAKPALPQYFEPLDLIKQTSALLDNWEMVTDSPTDWYGPSGQGRNAVAYQEVYGNMHSNSFWLNYGQPQGSSASPSAANYYPESSQQYGGGGGASNCYGDGSEFANCGAQEQTRSQRQDSLICFSMNFHANSIQVMTTPSSTASATNGTGHRSESHTEEPESATSGCVSSSEGAHFATERSTAAVSSSSGRAIKCYLSSDSTAGQSHAIGNPSTGNFYNL